MRVLVTGGDGFLGTIVKSLLVGSGYDVFFTKRKNIENPKDIQVNLSEPDQIIDLLNIVKPGAIINLAANIDFKAGCISDLFSVNVLCPSIFADWCKKNSAFLFQASSILVHGTTATNISNKSPINSDTDYGKSKAIADEAISASGCRSCIVRFGGIYGKNGAFHLGINKSISLAMNGCIPVIQGTGIANRNYIYVKDAVMVVVTSLKNQMLGTYYAGGEVTNIKSMLESICGEFLPGQRAIVQEAKDGKDQIITVSPEFQFFRTFENGIKDIKNTD